MAQEEDKNYLAAQEEALEALRAVFPDNKLRLRNPHLDIYEERTVKQWRKVQEGWGSKKKRLVVTLENKGKLRLKGGDRSVMAPLSLLSDLHPEDQEKVLEWINTRHKEKHNK